MSSFDDAVKRHQHDVDRAAAREQAEQDEALRQATIVSAKTQTAFGDFVAYLVRMGVRPTPKRKWYQQAHSYDPPTGYVISRGGAYGIGNLRVEELITPDCQYWVRPYEQARQSDGRRPSAFVSFDSQSVHNGSFRVTGRRLMLGPAGDVLLKPHTADGHTHPLTDVLASIAGRLIEDSKSKT